MVIFMSFLVLVVGRKLAMMRLLNKVGRKVMIMTKKKTGYMPVGDIVDTVKKVITLLKEGV